FLVVLTVSFSSPPFASRKEVSAPFHIYRVESGGQRNQNRKNFKKFFSGMKKARTKHIVCTSF
ncbi:hypothetical protein J0W45_12515, partial [Clostridioides difficile]|nr:hypothetical protein [Clostridioides difficile]